MFLKCTPSAARLDQNDPIGAAAAVRNAGFVAAAVVAVIMAMASSRSLSPFFMELKIAFLPGCYVYLYMAVAVG